MSQIQVELQESMGSDRSIADAAWTSSSNFKEKQKKTDEQVAKVVNMLADQRHSTPFESVVFRFWIKMPIAIDRQHMTHRIASHNGMSGRYRTMPTEFLKVPSDVEAIINEADCEPLLQKYSDICSAANGFYEAAISSLKIARDRDYISGADFKRVREFFRGVLSQHNMTERVTVMNLRSFANYQKLRNSEHAQPEIQLVAKLMLIAVENSDVCPIALEALKRNYWNI